LVAAAAAIGASTVCSTKAYAAISAAARAKTDLAFVFNRCVTAHV
jgi:hypothetical protein